MRWLSRMLGDAGSDSSLSNVKLPEDRWDLFVKMKWDPCGKPNTKTSDLPATMSSHATLHLLSMVNCKCCECSLLQSGCEVRDWRPAHEQALLGTGRGKGITSSWGTSSVGIARYWGYAPATLEEQLEAMKARRIGVQSAGPMKSLHLGVQTPWFSFNFCPSKPSMASAIVSLSGRGYRIGTLAGDAARARFGSWVKGQDHGVGVCVCVRIHGYMLGIYQP